MCTSTDVEAIDTRVIDGVTYRVYLEQDPDAESPRETDTNVGVIVARSSQYTWPVEDGDSIGGARVADAVNDHDFHVVARWLRVFHRANVVLPLYSTGYESRPVAGQGGETPEVGDYIGVTFDQPSTRRITGVIPDHMSIALDTDVDEYSTWAVGECYGYVIERAEHDDSDPLGLDISDHADWEHVDSCWGMIGDEYAREAGMRALGDL